MSSSSPASTTTLLPLSPTDGSEGTAGSHGLNFFYGFLLTSVGLLVIFILCGIGSRQRFAARRNLNYALESGRLNDKLEGGEEPQFYEPLFVTGEDKWSGLMPLCAIRCFREKERDSIAHDLPEAAPPPTPAHPHITGRALSWFNNNPSQAYHKPPDTLQVAVMIVMPSRNVSPNNSQGPPPEYEIGEISLPWGHDDPQPNS